MKKFNYFFFIFLNSFFIFYFFFNIFNAIIVFPVKVIIIIIGTLFTFTKKVKSRTIIHHTTNSFKAHVKLPPQSKPAPTKRIADQNAGHELFFLPRCNEIY